MIAFADNTSSSRSQGRLLSLLLVPVVLIALGPVVRLLLEGIGYGSGLTGEHLVTVLSRDSTRTALLHSMVTAAGGTAISIVIGAAFAFLVALTDVPGEGGAGVLPDGADDDPATDHRAGVDAGHGAVLGDAENAGARATIGKSAALAQRRWHYPASGHSARLYCFPHPACRVAPDTR